MARDLYSIHVREVMSKEVVTVAPHDSLHESLQLMVANKIAALPVIDAHDRCVGMLSSSDFLELTSDLDGELTELEGLEGAAERWVARQLGSGIGHDQVADHMTDHVATISSEAKLIEAAEVMLRNHVHRLPVIDASQRLVGIVSTIDLLRAWVESRS
jgi:CBS domain-containing membrane protein